jgi:hypothetical protein
MKKTSARFITLSAAFLALTIVLLYIGNIFPAVRLAAAAAGSLMTVAAVIEAGLGSAALVYIGSAALGFLILPDKTGIFLYILFFGYYPVVKSLGERIKGAVGQWAVKIAVFNAALTAVWFLLREIVFSAEVLRLGILLVYLAGNAVFVLFDIGLTRLISFYIVRISKNIRKNYHN